MKTPDLSTVPREELEEITYCALERLDSVQSAYEEELESSKSQIEIISGMEFNTLNRMLHWIETLKKEQQEWLENSAKLSQQLTAIKIRLSDTESFIESLSPELLKISRCLSDMFAEEDKSKLVDILAKAAKINSDIISNIAKKISCQNEDADHESFVENQDGEEQPN